MVTEIIFETEITPDNVSLIKEQLLDYMKKEDNNAEEYYETEERIHYERGYSLDSIKTYKTANCDIYINTGGGEAFSGLGLASFIGTHSKAYNINTLASGVIASAGIPIFVSARRRLCYPYTQFIYHTVRGGYAYTLQDKQSDIEECKRIQKIYDQIIINNSYLDQETLDKWKNSNVDKIFSAEEAVEYGIVDEIIGCCIEDELVSTERDFVDSDGTEYTLID